MPRQHHKNLKSTNLLERLNEEIKRRTLVVRIFPNVEACLRLIRAPSTTYKPEGRIVFSKQVEFTRTLSKDSYMIVQDAARTRDYDREGVKHPHRKKFALTLSASASNVPLS